MSVSKKFLDFLHMTMAAKKDKAVDALMQTEASMKQAALARIAPLAQRTATVQYLCMLAGARADEQLPEAHFASYIGVADRYHKQRLQDLREVQSEGSEAHQALSSLLRNANKNGGSLNYERLQAAELEGFVDIVAASPSVAALGKARQEAVLGEAEVAATPDAKRLATLKQVSAIVGTCEAVVGTLDPELASMQRVLAEKSKQIKTAFDSLGHDFMAMRRSSEGADDTLYAVKARSVTQSVAKLAEQVHYFNQIPLLKAHLAQQAEMASNPQPDSPDPIELAVVADELRHMAETDPNVGAVLEAEGLSSVVLAEIALQSSPYAEQVEQAITRIEAVKALLDPPDKSGKAESSPEQDEMERRLNQDIKTLKASPKAHHQKMLDKYEDPQAAADQLMSQIKSQRAERARSKVSKLSLDSLSKSSEADEAPTVRRGSELAQKSQDFKRRMKEAITKRDGESSFGQTARDALDSEDTEDLDSYIGPSGPGSSGGS